MTAECHSSGCSSMIRLAFLVLESVSFLVYVIFMTWTLCALRATMHAYRLSQAINDEVIGDSVAMRYRWFRRRIIAKIVGLLLALTRIQDDYRNGFFLAPELTIQIIDTALLWNLCLFTHPMSWWRCCNSAVEPVAADNIAMTAINRITNKVADNNPAPLPMAVPVSEDVGVV